MIHFADFKNESTWQKHKENTVFTDDSRKVDNINMYKLSTKVACEKMQSYF